MRPRKLESDLEPHKKSTKIKGFQQRHFCSFFVVLKVGFKFAPFACPGYPSASSGSGSMLKPLGIK
jgi:hypothetical protein